jgi:hypothetical protein
MQDPLKQRGSAQSSTIEHRQQAATADRQTVVGSPRLPPQLGDEWAGP